MHLKYADYNLQQIDVLNFNFLMKQSTKKVAHILQSLLEDILNLLLPTPNAALTRVG